MNYLLPLAIFLSGKRISFIKPKDQANNIIIKATGVFKAVLMDLYLMKEITVTPKKMKNITPFIKKIDTGLIISKTIHRINQNEKKQPTMICPILIIFLLFRATWTRPIAYR